MATPPDFSVGAVLTAAQMNAIGLWRIDTCTATFTGGTAGTSNDGIITYGTNNTAVQVNNVFSADYNSYRIILRGGSSNALDGMRLTLGATTTGYYYGGTALQYASGSLTINGSNVGFFYAAEASPDGLSGLIDIFNPFQTARTTVMSTMAPPRTNGYWLSMGGYLNNATSYTSFTFTNATPANQTGGTIVVYGYNQ